MQPPRKPEEEWFVWFAEPRRFRSPFKLWFRDDVGRLECGPGTIHVQGRSSRALAGVRDLVLARQTPPWLAFVLGNLLLLGMIFGGVMKEFTPDNPATWALVVLLKL